MDRTVFLLRKSDNLLAVSDLYLRIARGEVANRAWNRLLGAWESFAGAMETLAEANVGTSVSRERWLQILIQELGYGRPPTSKAVEVEGRTYAISHFWEQTPIQ